tara:strand:- start:746 stop:949 length:204 start_codon:yes stop_codon:yes gene_type:complete
MAQRGRPRSKPMKKWNPKYSKVTVRVAMQNAFSNLEGFITADAHRFMASVLTECDAKALAEGQTLPE